jgi:hypothetical protein
MSCRAGVPSFPQIARMPVSIIVGKTLIGLTVHKLARREAVSSVVDIGAGMGTYARLLRPVLTIPVWIAVEIWGPYVRKFGLDKLYDDVLIADVRCLDPAMIPAGSLALMGDVIEHLRLDQALSALKRLYSACKFIIVSVPVGRWPQGEVDGNAYERHVHEWTRQDLLALPGLGTATLIGPEGQGIAVAACGATPADAALAGECLRSSVEELRTRDALIEREPYLPDYGNPATLTGFHERLRIQIALSDVK